uniref:Uncharacterized protein n=1 Tax=Anguilla anguilla TaxID=7936 RepID=A0A0E9WSG9_ANGAN
MFKRAKLCNPDVCFSRSSLGSVLTYGTFWTSDRSGFKSPLGRKQTSN